MGRSGSNEHLMVSIGGGRDSADEARFQAVIHHSPVITLLIEPDGLITSASAALTRLLGHHLEQVTGRHLAELVADTDREAINRTLATAASSLEPTTVEATFPCHDGAGVVDLELTVVNLLADPVVRGFVVTGHDIGDRKVAEAAVVDSQRQLAEAQRLARLGSWEWDIASGDITWSPQLVDLFDQDPESYPRDYDAYLAVLHPDDRQAVDEVVRASFESHQPFEVDHRVVAKDGSIRWLHGRGRVVLDGKVPVRMIGTCVDVTEQLRLQAELEALALNDSLTGLRNRRGFLLTAEQELSLARRLGLSAALVFADLDNLKEINDTCGHHEGDRALREIADLICATFRESDITARLGGDEYAVFLIDADPDNAHRAVERLRAELEQVNQSNAHPYELTLSIGVAVTDSAPSVEAMLALADEAMYADKLTGRRRPRLLVVEDDLGLQRLLEEHLRESFDVTCANDLDQALQALRLDRVDVVLLDRNLPDSRGSDTLDRIREAAGSARLVVMTAEGSEPEADTLRSGAADFIAKPFDLDVLDARLGRLVTRPARGDSG
jgi:diguanylate cyclase (GGDEF)-like protein/PAS domain S-box-containing protein